MGLKWKDSVPTYGQLSGLLDVAKAQLNQFENCIVLEPDGDSWQAYRYGTGKFSFGETPEIALKNLLEVEDGQKV